MTFFIFFLFGYFLTNIHKKYLITKSKNINFTKISKIEGIIISVKEKKFEKEIIIKTKKIYIDKEYRWNGKLLIKTKIKEDFLTGEYLKIKDFFITEIPYPKNPFEFDYKKFMERQGIFYLIETDSIERVKGQKNILLFFSSIRKKIEKRIEKNMEFNPEGCELVKLITIGSEDMPDFLKDIGVRSGIYHLFIISGIHIVFLYLFLKIIFIPFQKINNIYPKFFPILLFSILWFYNFLCGFKIPVTRAVLMFSLYVIFEILDREIEPIQSLCLACILFLMVNPYNIYSISFLLSFLSTAGILIIPKKINIKKNYIISSLIATISAQIMILPVLFYNFGFFYPWGIINNILFTPIIGLITINSFISIFIPLFAFPLNLITNIFLKVLVFISNISCKINIYFPIFFLLLYYFLILNFLFLLRKQQKIIGMGLVVLSLLFYINLKRNKEEEIIFFSTKNPFVLIHSGEKGLLVLSSKIENPNFYKNTISKMLREEKIKVEKIIFIGDKFLENLIFTSKFCKIMYLPKSVLSPPLNQNKNIFYWEEEKNVIFDKFLISSIGGNLQIEYDNLKILILLNENLAEINYPCKYFLIYPVNFKKNEKNEQILNRLKPFFFIFQKRIKKFENLQSLCKNYYLNNSCVILNLKSKIIKYWRDNGKY